MFFPNSFILLLMFLDCSFKKLHMFSRHSILVFKTLTFLQHSRWKQLKGRRGLCLSIHKSASFESDDRTEKTLLMLGWLEFNLNSNNGKLNYNINNKKHFLIIRNIAFVVVHDSQSIWYFDDMSPGNDHLFQLEY